MSGKTPEAPSGVQRFVLYAAGWGDDTRMRLHGIHESNAAYHDLKVRFYARGVRTHEVPYHEGDNVPVWISL